MSFFLYSLFVLAIVAADQITKYLVVVNIPLYTDVPFIPGVLGLTYVQNTGAAFSIGDGFPLFFVGVAAVICAAILAFMLLVRQHRMLGVIAAGLVFGGAVGNAVDRVLYQYVVDFFEFTFFSFPVFNVADICITCGVVLFMVYVVFFMDLGERGQDASEGGR